MTTTHNPSDARSDGREKRMEKLTERQVVVLRALAGIRGDKYRNSRDLTNPAYSPEDVRGHWAAPMDFGGTDGSHHSATALQLAKKGLVDRYKDGRINSFKSRNKSSCCYRINDAGLAALARIKEPA